jgi:hypothetical protein
LQGDSVVLSSDGSRAFVSETDLSNYSPEETAVNSFRHSVFGGYMTLRSQRVGEAQSGLSSMYRGRRQDRHGGVRNEGILRKILFEKQHNKWMKTTLRVDGGNATLRSMISVALAWDGSTAVVVHYARWSHLKPSDRMHQGGENFLFCPLTSLITM